MCRYDQELAIFFEPRRTERFLTVTRHASRQGPTLMPWRRVLAWLGSSRQSKAIIAGRQENVAELKSQESFTKKLARGPVPSGGGRERRAPQIFIHDGSCLRRGG